MSEELEIVHSTPPVDSYIQARVSRIPAEALQEKYLVIMERLGMAATLLVRASAVASETGQYGEDYDGASQKYNAAIIERLEFGRELAGLQYS